MAEFYHCSLKTVSRASGRSAVGCAAYRAGAVLYDERYDTMRDFAYKNDVVTHFTLAPDGAPAWASDIAQLWNQAEAREKRKDANLGFEWEVALPNELTDAQREVIARNFSAWLVEEYGVALTTGIHSGETRGNGKNDHMHCMMTSREITTDGWAGTKFRHFNTAPGAKNPEVERVREQAALFINNALEEAGSFTRVDHRSFAERGIIDREPTRHLGPGATGYERRGVETQRGDINRAIMEERLLWQMHQAQPEVTAELEREFSARFGDGPRPELVPEPPRAGEDLAPESEPPQSQLQAEPVNNAPAGEPRRVTVWGRAWRELADRARSFAARVAELWDDEGGTAKHEAPAPAAPEAAPLGIWQTLVNAERALAASARELWQNQRGSVPLTAASLWDAVQADEGDEPPAGDMSSPAPRPEPPTRQPQAPARDGPEFD